MKTILLGLFLFFISTCELISQTQTHNLDWYAGIGSNVDLTIEENDTVKWTWTSPNHSVENNPAGTSVETFDSGILGPNGSTFSHTFTVLGSNDYYCVVHGATNMSGTITVVAEGTLSTKDLSIEDFSIFPNPASYKVNLNFSNKFKEGIVKVYNIIGKEVLNKTITSFEPEVDISRWNPGVYIINIEVEGKSQTKRFIKQ